MSILKGMSLIVVSMVWVNEQEIESVFMPNHLRGVLGSLSTSGSKRAGSFSALLGADRKNMLAIMTIKSTMMAAINNVITSMFPLDNRDKMDSGLLAGLLDTLCYVGSSAAGTLLGKMSQSMGWSSVLITLFIFAGVAAVICLSFSALTRRKA